MSRTTGYDTEAAELVARTFAAVAATGGDEHEHVAASGDEHEPEREDGTVVRLGIPQSSAGRARRRHLRAAIGLAAAVAVAGVLIWDDTPSDVATGPVEAGELSPTPGWLPPGVDRDGEPMPATGDTGLAVAAAVLDAPGGGQVLVAEVSHEDGRPVEQYAARWVLGRLAGLFGESDDEAVVRSSGAEPRAIVAVPRGEVSAADVDLAVVHLAAVSPFGASGPPADGWTLRMVPVGWGPGLAPTVGRTFSGDDGMTSVQVSLVAGDLPGEVELGSVLGPIDPQAIGGVAGWRRNLEDSEQELLLWQEAPGVVGVVVAAGVEPEDVVRVARSVDADTPPAGDGDSGARVVAESNEGSEVAYRVEWADSVPGVDEGRCVTLVVGDEPSGPRCGIDQPDSTFLSFGPVAVVHGDDVYWGIVGPSVSTVELDRPGGGEPVVAEALSLDGGDPASMRYVVMVAPHSDVGTTTARFLDPDGQVLDTETIEFVGGLGG